MRCSVAMLVAFSLFRSAFAVRSEVGDVADKLAVVANVGAEAAAKEAEVAIIRAEGANGEEAADEEDRVAVQDLSWAAVSDTNLAGVGGGRAALIALNQSRNVSRVFFDVDAVARRLQAWLHANPVEANYTLLDAVTGERPKGDAPAKALGQGSFGATFLAEDSKTKKLVALKALKANTDSATKKLGEECEKADAIFEAIEAGQKSSGRKDGGDHVIRCFGSYLKSDPPFIALEFAGKRDGLEAYAAAGCKPSVVHGMVKQMLLGLAAFDEAKPPLIHHDLKWQNVGVDQAGSLRLIDLDTVQKGTKASWDINGAIWPSTSIYAPPEQTAYIQAGGPKMDGLLRVDAGESVEAEELWDEPGAFHNFACAPVGEAQLAPDESCPLAHSWDIFSAGVMVAGALCGLEEYGVAANREGGGAAGVASLVQQYKELLGLSKRAAWYMIGSTVVSNVLKIYKMKPSAFLKESEKIGERLVRKHFPELLEIYKLKRDYCAKLPASSKELLDRMVSADPARRPKPRELLESKLFQDVKTSSVCDAGDLGVRAAGHSGAAGHSVKFWLLGSSLLLSLMRAV